MDFTGTSRQVRGNINCPLTATQSAIGYVLKALLDPEAPNNQGILDVIEIEAESGSLLNPVFPAAVAYRAHTTQRIIDVVIGALAPALPERVIAASNGSNTTAVFSGVDPRSDRPYLYLETLGGGCGARSFTDGKDAVQQHIANTANLPIEAIETEYPLRVREYSLVGDSGGAGQFRGGLSMRRTIEPIGHSCLFNGAGERFVKHPWGLFGGGDGEIGRMRLVGSDGSATDPRWQAGSHGLPRIPRYRDQHTWGGRLRRPAEERQAPNRDRLALGKVFLFLLGFPLRCRCQRTGSHVL